MFEDTYIKGLKIFTPRVFEDDRGYFFESYNQQLFAKNGIDAKFVQDNESSSSCGVLRGLHFQRGEMAQAKLVRVVFGKVWDVAIDLRPNSPTYSQYFGIELSSKNQKQLFIPRGFAHGFVVLSKKAKFVYKCDNFYAKEFDGGVRFDDPTINIRWPVSTDKLIISEKDQNLPYLSNINL